MSNNGEPKVERLDLAYRSMVEINPKIIERFGYSVRELDLTSNHLDKDLHVLEGFRQLHTLVLDDNKITQHTKLPIIPTLHTLWVNSNLITNLSVFVDRVKDSYPQLKTLSMMKNEACPNFFNGHTLKEYKDYRLYVINRIQSLTILDSSPVTADERSEAARIYGGQANVLAPVTVVATKAAPEVEEDPKKKRKDLAKKELLDKEARRAARTERRAKRAERRELKAERQLELEKEKIEKEKEIAKKQDEFTDSEGEEDNNNNINDKQNDIKQQQLNNNNNNNNVSNSNDKVLPVFSSHQSPLAVMPPTFAGRGTLVSDDADDEDGGLASETDESDLPVHRVKSDVVPLPPPNANRMPSADNDLDEDDDDTTSSEWSSDEDMESDNENINHTLPTRLTLKDQYYADEDDDDDDESEEYLDDEYEITHYPVIRRNNMSNPPQ
ncbi:leucine-rich repeat-containing protein [Heterostelium album PN500]|uniref:Leucine-rich repeat-containing protein n=1 Tax=Heterostelium pallidum (strain ATCC 26659 / Pp 5 / PN500) TaxID=670386 RepID=D3BJA2_HETP5|nr:leucine-rich repeat-containing protein [Heterostelium album PN500]EFA77982.1 leucine-rich repeat-containing protein [Heterostelium album PN500]|eukprot:XP_020430110.1 leucine-rich repeat-containing protein [Heterostelium album PN500]